MQLEKSSTGKKYEIWSVRYMALYRMPHKSKNATLNGYSLIVSYVQSVCVFSSPICPAAHTVGYVGLYGIQLQHWKNLEDGVGDMLH